MAPALRRVVFLLLLIGTAADTAVAQHESGPHAGVGGVIRGQVVGADTGVAVRDAVITLQPVTTVPGADSGRPAASRLRHVRPAGVDPTGSFELTGVSAGRYRLHVEPGNAAARYVPATFPDPNSPEPAPLLVAAGSVIDGVKVILERGAAIAGRVVDETGAPMSMVSVSAHQLLAGGRRLASPLWVPSGRTDRTDDTGAFRLFGLPQGVYIVEAQPSRTILSVSTTGDGTPFIAAAPEYAPAYYPGARASAHADRIRVAPGEEYGPIEVVIPRVKPVRVRGMVVDPQGQPVAGVNVTLTSAEAASVPPPRARAITRPAGADGSFELPSVNPGEYAVTAYRYGDGAGRGPESGWTRIAVTDDVDGLVVRLRPAATIAGEVVFEGQRPSSHEALQVRSLPERPVGGSTTSSVQPGPDGTFLLDNQFGPTLIRISGLRGWHLKAVRLDGRDITEQPTDFAVDNGHVQVLVTQHAASVRGTVSNTKGRPLEASVLILAADPSLWHDRASTTKRAFSTPEGTFELAGLMPGRYLVIAVSREDGTFEHAPRAYFELLAARATPIVVAEGEEREIRLQVTGID